jgi:hypothetical protein
MNPLGKGNSLPPNVMKNIQQLKGLMQTANGNPTALLQNNPQLQQVLNLTKGRNPEQVFYELCQQKGINPDDVLNMFK